MFLDGNFLYIADNRTTTMWVWDVSTPAAPVFVRTIVAHADPTLEGVSLPPGGDLSKLVARAGLSQLFAIYSSQGQNLEHRVPLLLRDKEIGHLVGKLFVDHLSALKRELIKRRMKRLKAQRAVEKKGEATVL